MEMSTAINDILPNNYFSFAHTNDINLRKRSYDHEKT